MTNSSHGDGCKGLTFSMKMGLRELSWDLKDDFFSWVLPLRVRVTRFSCGELELQFKAHFEKIFHNART